MIYFLYCLQLKLQLNINISNNRKLILKKCSVFYVLLQKPHRLLPTNLYVILYNFKARHPDELDLKAGYKVSKRIFFLISRKALHVGVD